MERDMNMHVNLAAWLNIALGVLGLLIACIVFFFVVGGGLLSRDAEAIAITGTVGTVIGLIFAIFSVPGIIAGFGLLQRWNWARVLAIILGFLNLPNFPIGTAIGIYTIWVLLQEETTPLFSG